MITTIRVIVRKRMVGMLLAGPLYQPALGGNLNGWFCSGAGRVCGPPKKKVEAGRLIGVLAVTTDRMASRQPSRIADVPDMVASLYPRVEMGAMVFGGKLGKWLCGGEERATSRRQRRKVGGRIGVPTVTTSHTRSRRLSRMVVVKVAIVTSRRQIVICQ